MRLLVALFALLLAAPARSEIVYARPDADPPTASYVWEGEDVSGARPLAEVVEQARAIGGSRPLEIRLLHRPGTRETIYSLALGTTASALKWHGSRTSELTVRGQVDRSGLSPRALTTIAGTGPLSEILCKPQGVDLCDTVASSTGPKDRRQDLLDYLSGELDSKERSAKPDIPLRLNCIFLWESAFVHIRDIGFRDCWLASVATYASSNIKLQGTIIEGSTYAFAAIARKGVPASSHSFEIIDNVWRQSPATYRPSERPCDIHKDWSCPVSIWSDIPWGIVHHYFWSPLNGALFIGKDIRGNVRVAGNRIIDAYNGIRVKLSVECLAAPSCSKHANAGFEIVGNTFERIRDNAIEPEGHASYWIIKHNTFADVYAPISTDGVAGNDFLVFGNVFTLDDAPGDRCVDEGWMGSRQLRLVLGGGGQWSTAAAEGDDARCSTHVLGTVIKMGGDDQEPGAPLLERILFFNNSLRTRSPLFRGSPGPPISSWNNAVEFTGCGQTGKPSCRQVTGREACAGKDIWTTDNLAVFAECFPLTDPRGQPIPHRMRYNLYDRTPGPELAQIDTDRVASAKGSFLEQAGCALVYESGNVECGGGPGPVGAIRESGEKFDLHLPFRFPFHDVLRGANR